MPTKPDPLTLFNPAQVIFTNREQPQLFFLSALEEINQKEYSILNFYGIGGIGKSCLQQHLKKIYLNKNKYTFSDVDFSDPNNRTLHKTLRTLVQNFKGNEKIVFKAFTLAYIIYWTKAFPDQDIKKSGLPFLEEGGLFAEGIDIIESIGGLASLSVSVLNYIYSKIKTYSFDDDLKKHLTQLGAMTCTQIENRLAYFFSYDIELYKCSHPNNKVIIFIDTHEALWEEKRTEANRLTQDKWLRNELIAYLPEVLFVISGREKLIWDEDVNDNWGDYLDNRQHLIGNLSDSDIRDFLINCHIHDNKIQDRIIFETKGVPYYLDLYVEILKKAKKEEYKNFDNIGRDDLFERFMRYLDKEELETLKVISHAQFYTVELFELLVEKFKTGYPISALSQLNQFSFVREEHGKFYLHDLMRESLMSHVERNNNKLFRTVHHYLFKYYDKKIQCLTDKNINEESLNSLLLAFYHKAKIANAEEVIVWYDKPFNFFKKISKQSYLFEVSLFLINKIDRELEKENSHTGTLLKRLASLKEVNIPEGNSPNLSHNTHAFRSLKESSPSSSKLVQSYKERIVFSSEKVIKTNKNLYRLAKLYEHNKKYKNAENLYKRCLFTLEKEGSHDSNFIVKIMTSLASLYNKIKLYNNAEIFYKKALVMAEKLGTISSAYESSLLDLSIFYRDLGKYEEVEYLSILAKIHRDRRRYNEAESLYKRCLRVTEKLLGKEHIEFAVHLNNLATLYYQEKKYNKALSLYEEALEIMHILFPDGHLHIEAFKSNIKTAKNELLNNT